MTSENFDFTTDTDTQTPSILHLYKQRTLFKKLHRHPKDALLKRESDAALNTANSARRRRRARNITNDLLTLAEWSRDDDMSKRYKIPVSA